LRSNPGCPIKNGIWGKCYFYIKQAIRNLADFQKFLNVNRISTGYQNFRRSGMDYHLFKKATKSKNKIIRFFQRAEQQGL